MVVWLCTLWLECELVSRSDAFLAGVWVAGSMQDAQEQNHVTSFGNTIPNQVGEAHELKTAATSDSGWAALRCAHDNLNRLISFIQKLRAQSWTLSLVTVSPGPPQAPSLTSWAGPIGCDGAEPSPG